MRRTFARQIEAMTDSEIFEELEALDARWKEFRADIADEGMAGSPGEWMVERMDALDGEQRGRWGGCGPRGRRRS